MLTDKSIFAKLPLIQQRYEKLRYQAVADVSVELFETRDYLTQEPDDVPWSPAPVGTAWGGEWMTGWFRGDVVLPVACEGKKTFLRACTGAPEALFLLDGVPHGVFDANHPVVALTISGDLGRMYHVALEAYSGHTHPGTQPSDVTTPQAPKSRIVEGIEVVLEREDVGAFALELRVLLSLLSSLDENSLRRGRIQRGMAEVYAVVDALPELVEETVWRSKLAAAREIMRPLLDAKNGTTAPTMGIVGHSHIDTAWLWPLEETRRKCGRTFSSVLNLMEQYPEFLFIQSTPAQTEMVREDYPEMFTEIQERVAEGRWEPNGGMWVEPDCNLTSGEAMVRQLLVGQTATREMFGYTSDTLWMPDVFGYSAALPQILQGAGVRFFCTTKIAWNDTTRFPYDTFVWKGIDGSSVITHYNAIHCVPDPKTLNDQWNWVQHKDVQDRRLSSFGWGDGGGGPEAEMIEIARLVQDLEGCPRATYTTVGAFMEGIETELTDLPEWVGELYLEAHRGTLTSIAQIKRGNRKAEFATRDAEFLSVLAALQGQAYPAGEFLALWKGLLTHQFHDILPGSSIAEVNDEAVVAFAGTIKGAQALSLRALSALAGEGTSERWLLANSLSWDRGGEITWVGAPSGTRPADETIAAQWVEDPTGSSRLVLAGLTLPALGGCVVDLEPGEPGGDTPFVVTDDGVVTPYATVHFDSRGRIDSFVDKATQREIVRPGAALNTLLLGEDIPGHWDNWDIDRDQRLKMRDDSQLVSRDVVANGPLQLRIRSTYRIGRRSTLTQDMVFHAGTPQVDFETVVDWAEKRTLMKVAFPLNVWAEQARHEIQYGYAERPTHTNLIQDRARFEVCAHKWTDLSDAGFGVALLNDCKYGVSVEGGEIGLSLLKSGVHPDPRGDEGRHLVTYSLLPHAGTFSVPAVVRPAYELNIAPVAIQVSSDATDLASLLTVEASNVIVEAVKWAEEGNAFVIRLYEAGRAGTRARVQLNTPVAALTLTNLLEEAQVSLELVDNAVTLDFRPFEIKTLRFAL